jgi:hypothetical protein
MQEDTALTDDERAKLRAHAEAFLKLPIEERLRRIEADVNSAPEARPLNLEALLIARDVLREQGDPFVLKDNRAT